MYIRTLLITATSNNNNNNHSSSAFRQNGALQYFHSMLVLSKTNKVDQIFNPNYTVIKKLNQTTKKAETANYLKIYQVEAQIR